MPEGSATIRSMAIWVSPVLVGPITAVTPRPVRDMGRPAMARSSGRNEVYNVSGRQRWRGFGHPDGSRTCPHGGGMNYPQRGEDWNGGEQTVPESAGCECWPFVPYQMVGRLGAKIPDRREGSRR